jgi:hypothetical protein
VTRRSDEIDPPGYSDEDLFRMAAAVLDPFYGQPLAPPRRTPAELREIAGQRRRAAHRRRWFFGTPLVAATAVVLVLAASRVLPLPPAPTLAPDPAASAPAAAQPAPEPLPLTEATHPAPARTQLAAMAARAAQSAGAGPVRRYTYMHTRTWSRDLGSGEPGAFHEEWLWYAADRSGRRVTARLSTGSREVVDYRPGAAPVVVGSPSADPPILASQLADHHDFASGPQGPLRAVVDMYRYHVLDPDHRAAALRVLADTAGLLFRGEVTDAAGRTGVAVSVDSDHGATRDVAVFDRASGALLSYERVALLATARSPVRPPAVISMVLFLAAGYVDDLGKPTTPDVTG